MIAFHYIRNLNLITSYYVYEKDSFLFYYYASFPWMQ